MKHKARNEANRKGEGHTLKGDLSTSDNKTIKQRGTEATCNSKIKGNLVMYP